MHPAVHLPLVSPGCIKCRENISFVSGAWQAKLREMIPSFGQWLIKDADLSQDPGADHRVARTLGRHQACRAETDTGGTGSGRPGLSTRGSEACDTFATLQPGAHGATALLIFAAAFPQAS